MIMLFINVFFNAINALNSPIVGYPEFRATDGKTSSLASSSHDGLFMSWQREMRLLTSLLQNPITAWGGKILTHPVVQIFMEQKWRRVRKYFWCSFIFYVSGQISTLM